MSLSLSIYLFEKLLNIYNKCKCKTARDLLLPNISRLRIFHVLVLDEFCLLLTYLIVQEPVINSNCWQKMIFFFPGRDAICIEIKGQKKSAFISLYSHTSLFLMVYRTCIFIFFLNSQHLKYLFLTTSQLCY